MALIDLLKQILREEGFKETTSAMAAKSGLAYFEYPNKEHSIAVQLYNSGVAGYELEATYDCIEEVYQLRGLPGRLHRGRAFD